MKLPSKKVYISPLPSKLLSLEGCHVLILVPTPAQPNSFKFLGYATMFTALHSCQQSYS